SIVDPSHASLLFFISHTHQLANSPTCREYCAARQQRFPHALLAPTCFVKLLTFNFELIIGSPDPLAPARSAANIGCCVLALTCKATRVAVLKQKKLDSWPRLSMGNGYATVQR